MLDTERTFTTEEAAVKLSEVLSSAGDAITVKRVYTEPYERDGVTVIAGAMVAGGGGGGGGHDEKGQEGEGGGFGVNARPSGAFVIRDGRVRWRPAVDVNQLIMMAGAVAVTGLLAWARRRQAPPNRRRPGRRPRLRARAHPRPGRPRAGPDRRARG